MTQRGPGRPRTDFCSRGHLRTEQNTLLRSNGTRECRECKRIREKGRVKGGRADIKKRDMLAPGEMIAKIKNASPITLAQWYRGWLQWRKYSEDNVITLKDERTEALVRLAYRYPSEYSALLEEVQATR